MLCCVCKKNRAAKIRDREADGRTVREYYCADCYARLFSENSLNFAPKSRRNGAENAGERTGAATEERTEKKERRCPYCGTTAREYYQTKLLGCAECYRYLFDEIKESVFAMQGDEPHRGKRPAAAESFAAEEKARSAEPESKKPFGGYRRESFLHGEEEQLTIFGVEKNMAGGTIGNAAERRFRGENGKSKERVK